MVPASWYLSNRSTLWRLDSTLPPPGDCLKIPSSKPVLSSLIQGMRYLSLLLLGPWIVVLACIYWAAFKRSRVTWLHAAYDMMVVIVALGAAYGLALVAYDEVVIQDAGQLGRESGSIWKQVMPALYGYGAFAAVMVLGMALRFAFWRRKRAGTQAL